jgi:hypothetical protein
VQLFGALQSFFDQVDVAQRRFPTALRFLLEHMQHIDRGRKAHGVDRPVGAAHVVLAQFQHADSAETAQRLGHRRHLADLDSVQSHAEAAPDLLGNTGMSRQLEAIHVSGFRRPWSTI